MDATNVVRSEADKGRHRRVHPWVKGTTMRGSADTGTPGWGCGVSPVGEPRDSPEVADDCKRNDAQLEVVVAAMGA